MGFGTEDDRNFDMIEIEMCADSEQLLRFDARFNTVIKSVEDPNDPESSLVAEVEVSPGVTLIYELAPHITRPNHVLVSLFWTKEAPDAYAKTLQTYTDLIVWLTVERIEYALLLRFED